MKKQHGYSLLLLLISLVVFILGLLKKIAVQGHIFQGNLVPPSLINGGYLKFVKMIDVARANLPENNQISSNQQDTIIGNSNMKQTTLRCDNNWIGTSGFSCSREPEIDLNCLAMEVQL